MHNTKEVWQSDYFFDGFNSSPFPESTWLKISLHEHEIFLHPHLMQCIWPIGWVRRDSLLFLNPHLKKLWMFHLPSLVPLRLSWKHSQATLLDKQCMAKLNHTDMLVYINHLLANIQTCKSSQDKKSHLDALLHFHCHWDYYVCMLYSVITAMGNVHDD